MTSKLPKIFFMHVPKCGGTTVDRAFTAVYRKNACHLDAPATNRALNAMGGDQDIHAYRHGLLNYFMACGHRYISGHFTFNEIIHRHFHEEYRYVTLLRDPVERFISHYFYNRHHNLGHYPIDQQLDEFLDTPRAEQLGRFYQLFFSCSPSKIDDVAAIRNNIMKFDVIGSLENLDGFRKNIREKFGIGLNFRHYMKNPKSKEEQQRELRADHMKKIRKLCEDDCGLYDWVKSRG